jgi:hypothetical protein
MTAFYASASVNNGDISTGVIPIGAGYNQTNGCTVDTVFNRIQVANAGVYRICAVLNCSYSGTLPLTASFAFFKNGVILSTSAYSNAEASFSTAHQNETVSFELIASLNANDLIDVRLVSTIPKFGIGSGMLSVTAL